MIRVICKDEIFLAQKAAITTAEDLPVADDLLETLIVHKDGCVGMAANMIGVNKRIIAFDNDGKYMMMFNPQIIRQSQPYQTEEGCLSSAGSGSQPQRASSASCGISVKWSERAWKVRK